MRYTSMICARRVARRALLATYPIPASERSLYQP